MTEIPQRSYHPAASVRWYCLQVKDDMLIPTCIEPGEHLIDWSKKQDWLRLESQYPLSTEN